MTQTEIANLIAFARELDRRLKEARIKQKELSEMTAKNGLKPISPGYISDILRVGRDNSKKYFRVTRDKVLRIAEALNWPSDEALHVAGYTSAKELVDEASPAVIRYSRERLNELLRNYPTLPQEDWEDSIQNLEFELKQRLKRRQ